MREAAKASFAEKSYTIKVGQIINLTDELTEEVEIVKWKTTYKTIAKVNQRGQVVGIRKGIPEAAQL